MAHVKCEVSTICTYIVETGGAVISHTHLKTLTKEAQDLYTSPKAAAELHLISVARPGLCLCCLCLWEALLLKYGLSSAWVSYVLQGSL